MVQVISNQSTQLPPALDPSTTEEEAPNSGDVPQEDGTQQSQPQGSSGLVPPPIVNRQALAIVAQYGSKAQSPPTASTVTSATAQEPAGKPSAAPASSTAQPTPSHSDDSGVLGWVEHAAGTVTSTVGGAVKSAINGVVDGQRATDEAVAQAGGAIDSAVNSVEHGIDSGRAWLRENGGTAGQVASDAIGFNEGAALGLYGMGKGIVQMADGASQLLNPVEWAANPQANLGRIESTANAVEGLGKIASLAAPGSWMANPEGNSKLASALWHSGVQSFQSDPSKFLGNATATVATFFVPGAGEAGAVADVAKATDVAADASKVVDAANGATKVASAAADTGKVVSGADDTAKALNVTSDATSTVNEARDATQVADAANDVAAGPVRFMKSGDQFFKNVSKRPDVDQNAFDVVAHGLPKKIQIETPSGTVLADHRLAAKLIAESPGYTAGQNIRLLSCSTGASDTGFAQNLANKLGVEVSAPSDLLWAYGDGRMVVAPRRLDNPKLPDLNKQGTFRTFTPGRAP